MHTRRVIHSLGVALMLALPGAALAGGHGGHGGSHSSSGSSGSSHHEHSGIGAASSIANRTIASVERNTYGHSDHGHRGASGTRVVGAGHGHVNHEHPGPAAATRIANHTLASLDEYTYGHDDRVVAFAPAGSHDGHHSSHNEAQQGEEGHQGERAGQVRATALARRTVATVESNTYGTGRSVWKSKTVVASASAGTLMSGPVE
jgi:hypothetical protein